MEREDNIPSFDFASLYPSVMKTYSELFIMDEKRKDREKTIDKLLDDE